MQDLTVLYQAIALMAGLFLLFIIPELVRKQRYRKETLALIHAFYHPHPIKVLSVKQTTNLANFRDMINVDGDTWVKLLTPHGEMETLVRKHPVFTETTVAKAEKFLFSHFGTPAFTLLSLRYDVALVEQMHQIPLLATVRTPKGEKEIVRIPADFFKEKETRETLVK